MQKSISQQYLSCIKEESGQQASNEFQIPEQFHPVLVSGGNEFITKYAPEGRHVLAGPKRRLLLCSFKKGIKDICMVPVRRDTLRVPLSFF